MRWFRLICYVAAILSLIAALIHNWVIPEHYDEWWVYGLFFMVVGVLQGFYGGALLLWPRPWLFSLGVAGNLPIILLYVLTRTVGLPAFLPHSGHLEPVGPLDITCTLAECGLVIALLALMNYSARKGAVVATT